jgi:uncharacterized membrane protein YhaH (DUF805 family)
MKGDGMNWYIGVLKKYVVFSGRARRKEFWIFVLISFLISLVLGVIGELIGSSIPANLYGLAVLLPSLGVAVRRLHDTGRSGWWLLLLLLPVIGWIALIVFYAIDGQKGDNAYGPDPKAGQAVAAA